MCIFVGGGWGVGWVVVVVVVSEFLMVQIVVQTFRCRWMNALVRFGWSRVLVFLFVLLCLTLETLCSGGKVK